ncbi:ABC transporter ATP-binding protein [Streptomyces sp. BK022]|uniref:ABC transporter ATP-binding protein n=1 Tax=Streptomyces sp. BK022 TaxID=2512123 RepID=UPI00102925E2|nr:ABC transporter ATP-binding protein [Streptomyces sp. BK022]
MLRNASRWSIAGILASFFLLAVLPPVSALITGGLVQSVIEAESGGSHGEVWVMLSAFAVVTVAGWCISTLISPLTSLATRQAEGFVHDRLFALGEQSRLFPHLETSAFADDVSRVVDSTDGPNRCLGLGAVTQIENLSKLLGAICLGLVIARVSVLLALLLIVTVFAIRHSLVKGLSIGLTRMDEQVRARRRGQYLYDLVSTAASGKEVRTFGLGTWLVDRFRKEMHDYHQSIFLLRRGLARREGRLLPVLMVVSGAAFLWPAVAALHGRVSVNVMTSVVMACLSLFTTLQAGQEQMYITPARLALRALGRIEAVADEVRRSMSETVPAPSDGAPLIRFSGVRFGYNRRVPVLNGLDLEVKPGEVLAIVGVNGVGKTTLTKLLAGLYQPEEGRITADGIEVGLIDSEQWHAHLAVVFQDFVKYPLSARENIVLAAPALAGDEELIRRVVEEAGVSALLAALPNGLDTPLSSERTGGVDLSGGQWQKIAIARALFAVRAGARVLILDEPTAHLDIRAEAAFFSEVVGRISGVSTILISHRLSTVRQADRIVLLDQGRVAESGTHDQLLALNGQYSEMFHLQAARFKEMNTADGAA